MIDIHTHCLQPEHWGNEHRTNWEPIYGTPWPTYTPPDFDEAMLAADVGTAIVFGIRATRAGVQTPNRFVAEFVAQLQTRAIGFMALDPTDHDVLEQLKDGRGLGLRGIKLYPVLAGFRPDDLVFDPFYAAAQRYGLPVLWHMGATPSAPGDLSVTQPILIDAVARRFPRLVQIIAHMGHPWFDDTVVVLRKNPNVFADISGVWTRPLGGYMALALAKEWGVIDKLLFGSDYPIYTPRDSVQGLRALTKRDTGGLPQIEASTIEAILDRDPLDLLGLGN